MQRSTDRCLTTHVGSLVRPAGLRRFIDARAKGESFDPGEYGGVLRECVAEVVRRQADAGIDVISDGKLWKSAWHNYIRERVTGFEDRYAGQNPNFVVGRDLQRFSDYYAFYI